MTSFECESRRLTIRGRWEAVTIAISHFCKEEAQTVREYHQDTQEMLPFRR